MFMVIRPVMYPRQYAMKAKYRNTAREPSTTQDFFIVFVLIATYTPQHIHVCMSNSVCYHGKQVYHNRKFYGNDESHTFFLLAIFALTQRSIRRSKVSLLIIRRKYAIEREYLGLQSIFIFIRLSCGPKNQSLESHILYLQTRRGVHCTAPQMLLQKSSKPRNISIVSLFFQA